jgi:glycosyltransferase involved in cell wall biosynthesis
VGIDARLVYQTGVGVYIRNLILQLSRMHPEHIEFHIYARGKDIIKLKDQLSAPPKKCGFVFHITQVSWHSFAEQIVFLLQLWGDHLDLMHFPYFSWPILYTRPFVATVHDTILLTQATGKATTKWILWYWIKHKIFRVVLAGQIRRALSIIVPSRTVAEEVVKFYPKIKHKIEVAYEGVDEDFKNAQPQVNARLENTQYFLNVGFIDALLIGLAQACALIPGVSRSGSVIVAMLLMNYRREDAATYSLALSVPTIFAATGYDLYKSRELLMQNMNDSLLILVLGFVISFVVGYFAANWLVKYLQKHTLRLFGIYRIAVGILLLVLAR